MHVCVFSNTRYSVTGFEQNRSPRCRTRSSYQGDWRGLSAYRDPWYHHILSLNFSVSQGDSLGSFSLSLYTLTL